MCTHTYIRPRAGIVHEQTARSAHFAKVNVIIIDPDRARIDALQPRVRNDSQDETRRI